MAEYIIPEKNLNQLNRASESTVRDFISRQTNKFGINSPQVEALSNYIDNRFGTEIEISERPELDQFGFYQLNDAKRLEAADSLASGDFIKQIEEQLEQRIPRFIPYSNQRLTRPTFGYVPPTNVENPEFEEARSNAIREGFKDNLARALNDNPKNIDIDSGLTQNLQRALLSFQQEPEDKLSFLQKEFGRENIKQFSYDGKPSFLIKQDGRQVLVDELGFSFGDVLDASRGIVTTTGEIIGGILGTKGVPLIPRGAKVLKSAIGAGTGRAGAEYISEGFEAGVNPEAEFQTVAPVLRGLGTTTIDYPMGKTFQFFGRGLFNQRIPGASEQVDDVIASVERLERRFADEGLVSEGEELLPLSPSMRMSGPAAQLEQEVIEQTARAGRVAPEQSGVTRMRLALADNLQRLIDTLQTGQGSMDELVEVARKNFDDLSSFARTEAKGVAESSALALSNHFKDLSKNIFPISSRRDIVQIGIDLRNTVRNVFESSKSRVDDAYESARIAGENIPDKDMLSVAEELIQSLDDLGAEIPRSAYDELISSFIPRNILQQLRKSKVLKSNAKTRLKQIAAYEDAVKGMDGDQMTMFPLFDETAPVDPGEPLTITFQQILDFKKNIGSMYRKTSRDRYLDRKGLGALVDTLDDVLEKMADDANSGAYELLQEANEMWLKQRKPILDDSVLAEIIAERQIDDIRVPKRLLDSDKNAVNRLKNLRDALPDEASQQQFDTAIRESVMERLFALAENQTNSLIDTGTLSKALRDNEIFSSSAGFFDEESIKILKRLLRVTEDRKNILGLSAAPSVPLELIKDIMEEVDLPSSERAELIARLKDKINLSNRVKAIESNRASTAIREGGGDVADNSNSTMEALLALGSSGQVKQFFELLDEPMKNQIRARVRALIFDGASTGSGPRTSTDLGEIKLPDVSSPIFINLQKKQSAQYEVAKEILGEEGLQDVLDVITVLDRMGGDYIADSSRLVGGSQLQAIGRGGNRRTFVPRVIIGFDTSVPIYKMLGMALSNEKFVRAINAGNADQAINNLLPFVFGSDLALQLFLEESTGDPRLINAIPRLLGSREQGVNDSLVNGE